MGVLPVAVLAFGLLFVVLGSSTLLQARRRRRHWTPYPGRVVATKLDDGQVSSRIADVREGRERQFWNRFTSTTVTDPVGREVEVLVNPDDPDDAVVGAGLAGGAAVGSALLLFGVVAVVVGLFLLR